MRIRSFTKEQAFAWLTCGRRMALKHPTFWALSSLAVMAVSLAIVQIPILGEFILVLLLPLVIGGAVVLMEGLASGPASPVTSPPRRPKRLRAHLSAAFAGPGEVVAGALGRPENLLVLLELCVIALGLALVGQILISLIAGSSVLENIQLAQMGFFQAWRLVISALAAVSVWFLLSTVFVYAVPLSLFGDVTVIGALYFGVRAAVENPGAYLMFSTLISLPLLLPAVAFLHSPLTGIVVALLTGALVLPIVLNSMYCCFKLTFDLQS